MLVFTRRILEYLWCLRVRGKLYAHYKKNGKIKYITLEHYESQKERMYFHASKYIIVIKEKKVLNRMKRV